MAGICIQDFFALALSSRLRGEKIPVWADVRLFLVGIIRDGCSSMFYWKDMGMALIRRGTS